MHDPESGNLWQAFRELAEQEWNRYGGTYLYRFPYDNLDKIQTDVEKMLSAPLTGQITRRFIRTSDRGLYEDLVKPMEKVREKRTTAGLDVNERIAEHLNKGAEPSLEDAKALYNELKKQGVDVRTFGGFYTRYQNKAAYRKNDAISLALSKAQSNEEKAAALSKFLGKKIDETQVKDAIKYLDLKNKKDRTKVEQVIFTSLKGRLGL